MKDQKNNFSFLLLPSSQLQLNKYHYKIRDKNKGEMFTFKYGLFATECGSGTCRSHRELHSNFLESRNFKVNLQKLKKRVFKRRFQTIEIGNLECIHERYFVT